MLKHWQASRNTPLYGTSLTIKNLAIPSSNATEYQIVTYLAMQPNKSYVPKPGAEILALVGPIVVHMKYSNMIQKQNNEILHTRNKLAIWDYIYYNTHYRKLW